ncbi:MAG: 23S rRNA (guanosine(2251)-2'-O)-methyltransferase RlmB [bacterium]
MALYFGRRPVLEILSAGTPVGRIIMAQDAHGYLIERIEQRAHEQGVPIVRVPRQRVEELFPGRVHQGVIAETQPAPEHSIEDLLQALQGSSSPPFVLILDGIEDPRNLGALVRTAHAAGVQGIVIPKHRSAGITPVVAKASAGATACTMIVRVANLVQTCEILKNKGLWIVGADVAGKDLWFQMDFACPFALVLGGEGKGIRRLLREECDMIVRLPMMGSIGSLNVSVAGGILMYEMLRQRMIRIPGYMDAPW